MIKLDRQIDVAQPGQREKSGQHNPARERRGIDGVEVFST
jgi:hypothetical protein